MGNLRIHGVRLLAKATYLKLQHLIFRYRSEFVTPLSHTVKSVGIGIVIMGHTQIALRRGKIEEVVACLCRYKFNGLGITLLGLGISQRLYAAVPFETVVTEKALAVTDTHRNSTEHVHLALHLPEVVDTAPYEECSACKRDILVDA